MSNPKIAQPAESGKDPINLSDAEVQRRIGALVVARGGETHLARELADVADYIAEARAAVGAMAAMRETADEFAYATVEALAKLYGAAVTLDLVLAQGEVQS